MPPFRKSYPFNPISPPQSGDFATPIVTLRIPQGIYTYIDGALENTLYDTRAWIGTYDEKEDAVEAIEQAMRISREPMAITAIDVADCVLRVKYGADTDWTVIGDLTACATASITDAEANTLAPNADATAEIIGTTLVLGIPQGIQGAAGADGENGVDGSNGSNGSDGVDGRDGVDGVDGRDGAVGGYTGETEKVITDDVDGHICAMAAGVAAWQGRMIVTALTKAREAFEFGKGIADQLTDMLDALPVAGALVNNLGDLFGAIASAGDWGDLIAEIGDPLFTEKVQCWYYCYMNEHVTDVINIDMFRDAVIDVASRAAVLPPAAPFITIYGQVYAAMLLTINPDALWLRAYVHVDETSDDCLTLCTDCPPEEENWCYSWTGSELSSWTPSSQGFDGAGGIHTAVGGSGVICTGENSYGYYDCTIDLFMSIGSSVITKVTWTSYGMTGENLDTNWQCRTTVGGVVDDNFDNQQTGNGTHFTDPVSITGDDLIFKIWSNANGSQGLSMVKFEGTGSLPSFTGGSEC